MRFENVGTAENSQIIRFFGFQRKILDKTVAFSNHQANIEYAMLKSSTN
jgi:hypothetical protein